MPRKTSQKLDVTYAPTSQWYVAVCTKQPIACPSNSQQEDQALGWKSFCQKNTSPTYMYMTHDELESWVEQKLRLKLWPIVYLHRKRSSTTSGGYETSDLYQKGAWEKCLSSSLAKSEHFGLQLSQWWLMLHKHAMPSLFLGKASPRTRTSRRSLMSSSIECFSDFTGPNWTTKDVSAINVMHIWRSLQRMANLFTCGIMLLQTASTLGCDWTAAQFMLTCLLSYIIAARNCFMYILHHSQPESMTLSFIRCWVEANNWESMTAMRRRANNYELDWNSNRWSHSLLLEIKASCQAEMLQETSVWCTLNKRQECVQSRVHEYEYE